MNSLRNFKTLRLNQNHYKVNLHINKFETILCETLSWSLEKMAQRTTPYSVILFSARILAVAFFCIAGVAIRILHLLNISKECII